MKTTRARPVAALHAQLRGAVVEHQLVEALAAELLGLVARERRGVSLAALIELAGAAAVPCGAVAA